MNNIVLLIIYTSGLPITIIHINKKGDQILALVFFDVPKADSALRGPDCPDLAFGRAALGRV